MENTFTWICNKCKTEKPLDKFGYSSYTANMHQHWCKECINKNAKLRMQDPEVHNKALEYKRQHRKNLGVVAQEKVYAKEYNSRLEVIARREERRQNPEIIAKKREWSRLYYQNQEVKYRRKEWYRLYCQNQEIKNRRRERDRKRRQRPEVKERERKYAKQRRQKPEIKEKRRVYRQKPEIKEREISYSTERQLLCNYGLTIEQYESIIRSEPKCPICEEPFEKRRPQLDHDHKTGRLRGVLCNKCNSSLGFANDSIDTLYKMILYLQKYKDK